MRDLNTDTSKNTAGVWQICCKVSKKHPIKVHAKGKLFKVDLTDDKDKQTMIEGTFYTEETDKFYEILEEGKSYFISNVEVSVANKRFTSIKNDFRLIFPMISKITEVSQNKPKKLSMTFAESSGEEATAQILNLTEIKDIME